MAAYICSQGTEAANILVSNPSGSTCPPSLLTSIEASRCSNSPLLHSPRSRAWTGLPSPAGPWPASIQGRTAAA